ncbi:MAG: cyanophycin synthetase, partial [Chloroflexota bacterium]|nr:cyanophycin synthetase [Chloroflexota bacterium]
TLPLLGMHQAENAITAVCTIETLQELGYSISQDSVELGLSNVCWPGRFEVLRTSKPVVIVDGAHNPDSIQKLVNTLNTTFKKPNVTVIFGAISGHDVDKMLEPLKSLNITLIPVSSRHPKSIDSKIVKIAAINSDIDTTREFMTVSEGLEYALKVYSDRDLILATGSLSVVAEVSEVLKQISPEIYPDLS